MSVRTLALALLVGSFGIARDRVTPAHPVTPTGSVDISVSAELETLAARVRLEGLDRELSTSVAVSSDAPRRLELPPGAYRVVVAPELAADADSAELAAALAEPQTPALVFVAPGRVSKLHLAPSEPGRLAHLDEAR